jgi:Flp pilus assembly protein TadD
MTHTSVDTPRTSPILRAVLVIAVLAGLGLLVVAPSPSGQRIAAVSRASGTVELLPARPAFSPVVLAIHHRLPREGDAAVIEVPDRVPLPGGADLPVRVRLVVGGSGRLPVDAGDVRRDGWESAWSGWLQSRLELTETEALAALEGSAAWREAFPLQRGGPLDLGTRLAAELRPLRLLGARLQAEPSAELVRALGRDRLQRLPHPRGRLVVVGLDALDWALVDELVSRAVMPNLGRLIRRGAPAVLHVQPPLLSPLIWTSFATGVPAEAHGILDFVERNGPDQAPRPISGASRKVAALWEMAAAAGRSTAVIGWWATFPAQAPPHGSVYSDRLTEQLMGLDATVPGLADPSEAAAVARRLAVRGSAMTPPMLAPILDVTAAELAAVPADSAAWDEPIGGLARLVAATLTVQRLTDHELGRGTQIVLSYIEGTDTVGHLFGGYRSPPLASLDPALAARFGRVADRYHGWVDAWLGRVAASLGPEDSLVIVSDHGFAWGDDRPSVPSGTHTPTAVHWHRPKGFFLAVTPGGRGDGTRRSLEVLDVAPALLALAGLPAGTEMPGRLPDWLPVDARTPRPAAVHWATLVPVEPAPRVELPPEARAEELAKLRALGYLGGDGGGGAAGAPAAPRGSADRDTAEARRLNNIGIQRASSGDTRGAEDAFRAALAADPSFAPCHYALALLLRGQGRYDEADTALWRAVEAGLGAPEAALARVAGDYRQRGEAARASAVLAEGCRRFPGSALLWLHAGTLAGERGEVATARAALERATALEPGDPVAWRNLAQAQLALGDRTAARASLEQAARLRPGDDAVRRQLATLGEP